MKRRAPNAPELGVVILAAGRSRRMGQPKLVLPWGNTTVVGQIISRWTGLRAGQLAIVCATGDQVLEAELARLGFPAASCIRNPAPELGMFSSVRCAASWPGWQPELTHWAIVLGDQPHLRFETLARLLQFARTHPKQVCQPALGGRPRHPVLMPKRLFFALASSKCRDLRAFLRPHPVALCELDDAGLDFDIDRPEDYQRAVEKFQAAT